jgi:TatD DNase family protein
MHFTDTHCHLYGTEFDVDRQEMMNRALAAGVNKFFLPNVDTTVIDAMLLLEQAYPGKCFAMMGLHPCSVKENYDAALTEMAVWFTKRKFAAVGEIGLDFYWDTSFTDQQYDAFKIQIGWAKAYKIPIVIHSRNSIQECIDTVRQLKTDTLTGIFHCFGGTIEQAREIMDLGFYMGIGGVVTYKNSGMVSLLEKVPLEYLVLETDAPYLTPVPFRGKRNESAYLPLIAEKIAAIKNITIEEVAEKTSDNALKIFGV